MPRIVEAINGSEYPVFDDLWCVFCGDYEVFHPIPGSQTMWCNRCCRRSR